MDTWTILLLLVTIIETTFEKTQSNILRVKNERFQTDLENKLQSQKGQLAELFTFLRSIMAVLDTHTPIHEIQHSGLISKTLTFS